MRAGAGPARGRVREPGLGLLQWAWLTSAFDRFVVGPLLVSMTVTFGAPLSRTAAVASGYLLCYGLAQPLWGACSDRLGRVRTMRLALGVATLAGAVASAAPGLDVLVVARAVVGGCFAAVIPTSIVYVGDAVPLERRQRALSDLQSAQGLGTTVAIALGGLLAATATWRLAVLLPAVGAGLLALALRRLPEPGPRRPGTGGARAVLRSGTARLVVVLALVEGAALLGFLAYLAPALEDGGTPPDVAGLVVALYGVGLLVAARVVGRTAARVPAPALLAGGSLLLAVAYAVLASDQGRAGVALGALLVGAAWAPLHSTMQTWATQAVPGARATMVSAYAAALFIGSGLATWGSAPAAGAGRWDLVFGAGAVLAVLCGASTAVARSRADAGGRPGHVRPGRGPRG